MSPRTILLCEDIGAETVNSMLEALLVLDSEKGDIEVRICSDGGWTQGAMAIYDAIRACRNRVITIGTGSVGSAAVLVLQAGDERRLTPNATLYLHQTSYEGGGSASTMSVMAAETVRIHEQYCRLIAARSNLDTPYVLAMCSGDKFVPATEAIDLGLADGIYAPSAPPPPKPRRRKAK